MYTQLFNLLCDRADDVYGGRLPVHVRCLLDEFANIGQIPKFEKLIATIRSREISASIILQSQSQLKAIYKDHADTILGNCDATLFLGGKESSTLKEMSEMLGKETIDLYNTSDTRGTSRSYGINYQKTGKDLMSKDELAVMDGGKCILQLRGVRPFFSNKFDITKHKRYRELSDSNPSNTTGTIFVKVYPVNEDGTLGAAAKNLTVDTYYGYKQEAGDADGDGTVEEGEMIWVVDPDAEGALYQVPVMKVEGLDYGHYQAVIQAVYEPIFDHVDGSETGTYDFYLDAIRIYDPANDGAADGTTDTTIEDAYKADGEGWPSYIELRNELIDAETLGNAETSTTITGLVFIDGDAKVGDAQISDYTSYGPNNEVYIAPGQRVAFILNTPANIANVHIGIKSADGKICTYTITNIAQQADTDTENNNNIAAGQEYGEKTNTIDTTTDMYYDLTGWKKDIIVISNTGDRYGTTGIISLSSNGSTKSKNASLWNCSNKSSS